MAKGRLWLNTVLVLAVMAGIGWAKEKRIKPEIILTVSPRMALAQRSGVRVRAKVTIKHPSEEMYCPGVTYEWGDDAPSTHESDCPPVEPGEVPPDFEDYHYSPPFGPGDHIVTVTLTQGKTSLRLTAIATIAND